MFIIPKHNTVEGHENLSAAADILRRKQENLEAGASDLISKHDANANETEKKPVEPSRGIFPSGIHQDKKLDHKNIHGTFNAIQVVGLNSKKTLYNKQNFADIKKSFSHAKVPLVLVRQSSSNGSAPRFFHGPEQLKRSGENLSKTLEGQEVIIFMGTETEKFLILKKILQDEISGSDALEAILGAGDNMALEEQLAANKCLLAALLHSSVLGVINEKMASLFYRSVPQDIRQEAMTCALYNCIGSGIPEIGQALLSWGANPNGIRPSDDFGALQHAVVCKDTAYISLLLKHGADPFKETESSISALEYSDLPEFSDMKPYLTKTGNNIS